MKTTGVAALALASVVHAHFLSIMVLEPGKRSPETMPVKAGDTVGFRVDGNVTHPGPLQFYMAKVPGGETAKTFAGDGDVWFKIFNDDPKFTGSWPDWPNWGKNEVSVTIPLAWPRVIIFSE
ncbi:hypothetical protein F4815DRAFT_443897 [Daldinia loculata]|nr:hypothetical protein F4815DRAFT_443897 [Daldinia loculata]